MNKNYVQKCILKNGFWTGNLKSIIGESLESLSHLFLSWDNLEIDAFMADNGKYRYRRYSNFTYEHTSNSIIPMPHSYFIQPKEYNSLNGGKKRYFHPLTPYVASCEFMRKIILDLGGMFSCIEATDNWKLYIHQVRIVSKDGKIGKPAPEGIHRDGVTFSVLLLINRVNISGGSNTVYDRNKKSIKNVTLLNLFDCIIVDDRKVFHSVNDIVSRDKAIDGKRDMLFLEFTVQ